MKFLHSRESYRDDRGSTSFQQAVPQYVNPPVTNQQVRDDARSSMLQHGLAQGSDVIQPWPTHKGDHMGLKM